LLREAEAHFGKTSIGRFFGLELYVLLNVKGQVVNAALTAADTAGRERRCGWRPSPWRRREL